MNSTVIKWQCLYVCVGYKLKVFSSELKIGISLHYYKDYTQQSFYHRFTLSEMRLLIQRQITISAIECSFEENYH